MAIPRTWAPGNPRLGELKIEDNIMVFTEAQQKILSIIPHITGSMSMIGSLSIIYDILSDRKERLKSPYFRILLAIGCVDTSSSFWIGLSTWPIPRGTANGEELVLRTPYLFVIATSYTHS